MFVVDSIVRCVIPKWNLSSISVRFWVTYSFGYNSPLTHTNSPSSGIGIFAVVGIWRTIAAAIDNRKTLNVGRKINNTYCRRDISSLLYDAKTSETNANSEFNRSPEPSCVAIDTTYLISGADAIVNGSPSTPSRWNDAIASLTSW